MPVHGRTADDSTTADGGGPEVVGTGRKAAGNTHRAHIKKYSQMQLGNYL